MRFTRTPTAEARWKARVAVGVQCCHHSGCLQAPAVLLETHTVACQAQTNGLPVPPFSSAAHFSWTSVGVGSWCGAREGGCGYWQSAVRAALRMVRPANDDAHLSPSQRLILLLTGWISNMPRSGGGTSVKGTATLALARSVTPSAKGKLVGRVSSWHQHQTALCQQPIRTHQHLSASDRPGSWLQRLRQVESPPGWQHGHGASLACWLAGLRPVAGLEGE